jgi:hypothetical protein
MLDLARTAVDAVVSELRSRADELVVDQASQLEQLSAQLGRSVQEMAQTSHQSHLAEIRTSLADVGRELAEGMARHDARLVEAVESHLAEIQRPVHDPRLPETVASAVLDGLDGSLPVIDKGIHELRELVGELLEREKEGELSRQRSLDRLDQVLVDLRAGLSENVARQHGVLLDLLDEKLGELQIKEVAASLPARIGSVISEAVQRSHDVQAESLQDLAAAISRAMDAGLKRQRAATAELTGTAAQMADSVTGFREVAEEAVTAAFQKAQAAQGKRLATMVDELRVAQQEAAGELVAAAEGALAGKLEASYDALGAQLRMAALAAEKNQQAQGIAFADAVGDLRRSIDAAVGELRGAQAEHAAALSAELRLQMERDLAGALEPLVQAVGSVAAQTTDSITPLVDAITSAVAQTTEAIAPLVEAVRSTGEDTTEALSLVARRQQDQMEALSSVRTLVSESTVAAAESTAAVQARLDEGLTAMTDRADAASRAVRSDLHAANKTLAEELERGQAALAEEVERNSTAMSSALDQAVERLAGLVTGQGEGVAVRVDALVEEVERSGRELAESRAQLARNLEVQEQSTREYRERLDQSQKEYDERLAQATERMEVGVAALVDSLPDRVTGDLAGVLDESRVRQERVERLIAELSWVLGEQRAGTAGLQEDLARALADLPAAIASLKEAHQRSEARITDLLARTIGNPDVGRPQGRDPQSSR